MGHWGVLLRTRPWLLLATGFLLAALFAGVASAQGPPATGDWDIGAGESVVCDHQVLDLRGDLHIDGELTLDNCTLVVWSTADTAMVITVGSGGALRCVETVVTPSLEGHAYLLRAERGSSLSMVGGALVGAGRSVEGDGRGAGAFIASDATLRGTFFEGCIAGIWISGANVTAIGCTFSHCEPGTVVADGGALDLEDCEFLGCGTGAVVDAATLTARGARFDDCTVSVYALAGDVLLQDSSFLRFASAAVMVYSSDLAVEGCDFQDGMGAGVVGYLSSIEVSGCRFLRCAVDVHCIESSATVSGTDHTGTVDEALRMEWSTFAVDGVTCNGSYWGLRTYMSMGSCRNLTCNDALLPVLIEQSIGVTLERVVLSYDLDDAVKRNPRGIIATGSSVVVRNATIRGVRTALALDYTSGLVERVNASDLMNEGVLLSMCAKLTLRDVHISNATDGFRINMWCDVTLEGCAADRCRATGFNFTYSGSPYLLRCNASNVPVGMRSEGSFPRIEDCEWYCPVEDPNAFPDTVGLDCLQGAPRVSGGTVTGWGWGMRFNGSRAHVVNVTFLGAAQECVLLTCSTLDTVEGCRFLGAPNSTGVVVLSSSPTLRDNLASGMRFGMLAMFNGSRPTFEGNVIEDISEDGLVVFNHAEAVLKDNSIRRCNGSALQVLMFSRVDCSGDVFTSCGAALVSAHTGSTVVVHGASFSNGSIGVNVQDSPLLEVVSCRFVDLGRGIVATRLLGHGSVVTGLDVLVEGCYFQNDSAYGVGVVNGALRVLECTFLANGGGVAAWNSTVELLDSTMVGNIVGGLMTDNCTTSWVVRGVCRVIGSPILSRVVMLVDGGELWLEETKVTLGVGGGLSARGGASVQMRDVLWSADGAPMTFSCCTVELVDVLLEGVGPSPDGPEGAPGIGLWGSSLVATDTTISGSAVGLTLTGCTARLTRCALLDCRGGGIAATGSGLVVSRCSMVGVVNGRAISLGRSTIELDNTTFRSVNMALWLENGSARATDCSLAGATGLAVDVEHGEVTLVNTTCGAAGTRAGPDGRIWTWWRVSAVVGWANASELSSIEVWVDDADGGRVAGATADATGRVRPMLVLASLETPEGLSPMGPHTVSAGIHGYTTRRSIELRSSVEVMLQLEDRDPPVITVLYPTSVETWTTSSTLELVIRAVDAGSGVARIDVVLDDGVVSWTSKGGTFMRTVHLTNGNHLVLATAWDLAGTSASTMLSVWVETRPIILVVNRPADGTSTNASTVTVGGYVSRTDVSLRVNGALVTLEGSSFSHTLELEEGLNRLTILVEDIYGHRSMVNLTLRVDRVAPELLLTTERTIYTKEDRVLLQGMLGEGADLVVNGRFVLVPPGWFNISCPVIVGETAVVLTATDDVGNTRSARVVVIRSEAEVEDEGTDWWQVVPFIIIIPLLAVTEWYVFASRGHGTRGGGRP